MRYANRHPHGGEEYFEAEEADPGMQIDVSQLIAILRRNLPLITAVLVIMFALGLAATLLMTPKYVATSSVQVDQEAVRVLDTEDVQPSTSYQDAERFLQTQTDVLRSRAMAIRVARALGLLGSPKFFEAMQVGVPNPDPRVPREEQMREATVDLLLENLGISLPRQSRVISISFQSPDPALAARIANSYASEFIANNLQRKYDSTSYARDFLAKQLAEAKAKLENSERDLNEYARRVGLIKTGDRVTAGGQVVAQQSVTTASLSQLNEAYNAAQAARIAAEQRWRTVSGAPPLSIPDVATNVAVQTMLQDRAKLSAQLSEELARHRESFPTVVQIRAQIDELSSQIDALAGNIKRSIRDQYSIALERERELGARVNELKGATLTEQDRGVQYGILAREADTNRTLYEGLLQRYKEVSAATGLTANNISIVDQAQRPQVPSSPKLLLNLALALVAGIGLAAVLVLLRERLDDAIRSPEDMERKLGLLPLGTIPQVGADEDVLKLIDTTRSHVAEAYHALRTSLLYVGPSLPRTLFVTSTQPAEGKSTTSYALAAGLAKLGKKTLLIDSDLRRPSLHRAVGAENQVGLSSLLTMQADIREAVQETSAPRLFFLPSGPVPPSPTELLSNMKFANLLGELMEIFEVVVIDGPPVLGLADAPMLSSLAEATLFVTEANRGHRGATKAALRRLRAVHANILGGVLTKFNPSKAGSNTYYGYDYYYYGEQDRDAEAR